MPSTRSNGHWSKSTAAVAAYVVAVTTGINQGLDRVVFPVRDDPFTGAMAEQRFKQVDAQMKKDREYLREYSDDNRKHQKEELNREILKLQLYVIENYLDRDTPIPPPEVVSRLDRSERLMQRHADKIDEIRTRLSDCCVRQLQSNQKKMSAPIVK